MPKCEICGEAMPDEQWAGGPESWTRKRFEVHERSGDWHFDITRHDRCWAKESAEETADKYRKEYPGSEVTIR